jgi:membrane protease YdiL (CAAX protease family)
MPFNPLTILLYLIGSVLFCLFAVEMAGANTPIPKRQANRPEKQLKPAIAVFLIAVAAFTGARFASYMFSPSGKEILDYASYGLVILSIAAVAAVFRDRPASLGLSTENIGTIAFFLIPPAGIAFLPGRFANWGLLLRGLTCAAAAAAFAQELLFRGFLQTRFQLLFGDIKGILAAAAAYAAFGLAANAGLMNPASLAVFTLGSFLISGVAMGFIYRRAGNIYGLVILHLFWDAAVKVFAGFGVGN